MWSKCHHRRDQQEGRRNVAPHNQLRHITCGKCAKRQKGKLTPKTERFGIRQNTTANQKFSLRIIRPGNPRENRRTIDRIEGRDGLHNIESPTTVTSIAGIPNGQDEISGMTFAARPPPDHFMEKVGIKTGGIPPLKFELQARKRTY